MLAGRSFLGAVLLPPLAFPQQQLAGAVHMALAGLLLAWLAARRGANFQMSPNGRTAVVCAARITLAAVAAAWAPVGLSLLLPNAMNSMWLTAEALFLAVLPLLLPLPLKQHAWVQALALRSVLARMRQVAWTQAAFPRQAARCVRSARCACLALLAVAPGLPEHAQHPQQPERACWMVNCWIAVVVGYLLPTAVLALQARHAQHAKWAQRVQRAQPPAQQHGTALGTGKAPRRQWRLLKVAPSVRRASVPSPQGGIDSHWQSSTSSSCAHDCHNGTRADGCRLCVLLPTGTEACHVAPSAPSMRAKLHAFLGSKGPRPLAPAPPSRLPHLASLAFTWLPLLLPCGALLWAALEVAARLL